MANIIEVHSELRPSSETGAPNIFAVRVKTDADDEFEVTVKTDQRGVSPAQFQNVALAMRRWVQEKS